MGAGNGVHGYGMDPVQLAQAMQINELKAHNEQMKQQLVMAGEMITRMRIQMRLNEMSLQWLLVTHYPQVDPKLPNVTIKQDELRQRVQKSESGVQFVDETEVEGVQCYALYVVDGEEQQEAAFARAREQRDRLEQKVELAPPGLILPK